MSRSTQRLASLACASGANKQTRRGSQDSSRDGSGQASKLRGPESGETEPPDP